MYRIVVADDECIVVEGVKAIISRLKLQREVTGFACNDIEALDVTWDKRPDIVIIGIRMPGLDGLSLVESCKGFLPEAYYVITNGYTELEYTRRAITLGVVDYIGKSVTMQKIMEVLEKVEKKSNPPQYAYNRVVKETDKVVDLVMMGKTDGLEEAIEHLLPVLRENVSEFERYHQEIYEIMSMLVQIFRGSSPDTSCQIIHHDMERQWNPEEYGEFYMNIVRKMNEHLQSKKVGSNCRIIQKLLQLINEKYIDNTGLNELAILVDVNPAYLSIPFRNEMGVTYVGYLTDLRIKETKELLNEGMEVVEVNEKMGYYNYRYFYEVFRRHQGITPNKYKGHVRKHGQVNKNSDMSRQYI